MVFVGISILIASLSFIFYKYLPSSWSFLTWFRRGGLESYRGGSVAGSSPNKVLSKEEQGSETKASLDYKAMPPPPPPSVRVSLLPTTSITPIVSSTPAESSPPSPSTSILADNIPKLSSPPVFPAPNSIQRASRGGTPTSLRPLPVAQPPLRTIYSPMPPPLRSPLPNRLLVSLDPLPRLNAIPTKPRLKVQLSPGHSPLDWAHLSSRPDVNLRGLPPSTPYLRVPPSLLRQYTGRKGKDAWTVLGGKVYNITPYLPYHPGGEPELMKAAGRDGTKLFGEIHPWVNWEGMLEPCLIGVAVGQEEIKAGSVLEDID